MTGWYAVASGTRKTAAEDHWTHGTASSAAFDRFDLNKNREDYDENEPKHWNSHLGVHLTSHHDVAVDIAQEQAGRVIHANLAMTNPKHYKSEYDLDHEGYQHGVKMGHLPKGPVTSWNAEAALRHHPKVKEIADSLKEHLKSQGHDGITYGNEFEGPTRHKCAIAFHPDDVKITSQHKPYDSCDQGDICQGCYRSLAKGAAYCDHCDTRQYNSSSLPGSLPTKKSAFASYPKPEEHGFYDVSAVPRATRPPGRQGVHLRGDGTRGAEASQGRPRALGAVVGGRGGTRGDAPTGDLVSAPHTLHTKVAKDLKAMDSGVRDKCEQGVRDVVAGEPLTMSHTHRLKGKMKGWDSSEVNGAHGYRVIHRRNDQGGIHVGAVTLHEYTVAQQRLASAIPGLPPEPGTAPIPEGHVRLWHYTHPDNLDSIREHGLLASKAHGDGGTGPNEESSGVWASTRPPEDFQRALHVEFHAPLSEISRRADDPWREESGLDEPGSFGKGYHHVIMKGDVKPSQIVGLHEPWHHVARQIRDNGGPDQYDDLFANKYKDPTGKPEVDDAIKAYHYLKGQQGKTAKVRESPKGEVQQRLASAIPGLPPDPGTAPIPEGHVRLWHFTHPNHLDSIREHGLLASKAHGDGGTGPNEESSGVWASTKTPTDDLHDRPFVEFHAHPSQISGRAETPPRPHDPPSWGTVDDWAKERHHVIMNGDVKPDQIVGIHEPWHAHARYIRDNGGHKEYSWLEDPKQNWGLDQEVKAYHYLKGQEGKTAKVREAPDDGEQHTGIMVAIVPPASVVESLVLEEGESANELHVTMAYLGNTDEYSEALLGNLHEVVEAWAEDQAKFTALVQGVGTFLPASEDEQHVLWASIGSPRLHRLQASLVDHLKGHGYDPRENHGFCAHVTLAYGKHHFRFMPKVKRQTFKVHEVWVVVAGRWESIPLGRPEHKKISA